MIDTPGFSDHFVSASVSEEMIGVRCSSLVSRAVRGLLLRVELWDNLWRAEV